jgi:hypothetical protein
MNTKRTGSKPDSMVMNWNSVYGDGFSCSRENRYLDKVAKKAFRRVLKKDKPFRVAKGDREMRKLLLKVDNPYKKKEV